MATRFGPTGEFPRGKHDESDEGELQIGVRVEKSIVVVNFGKPIAWLGMPPAQARELAQLLLSNADKAALVQ